VRCETHAVYIITLDVLKQLLLIFTNLFTTLLIGPIHFRTSFRLSDTTHIVIEAFGILAKVILRLLLLS